jgi:hypothetical protein
MSWDLIVSLRTLTNTKSRLSQILNSLILNAYLNSWGKRRSDISNSYRYARLLSKFHGRDESANNFHSDENSDSDMETLG